MRFRKLNVLFGLFFLFSTCLSAKKVIELKPIEGDMTPVLRKALESTNDKDVKIIFAKGSYKFLPDYAFTKYCCITNHGNGIKNIIFPMDGYTSIEIEGNGSEFIFHGQVAPFQFTNCEKVVVRNLSVDWDIPFLFEGKVVATNQKEGWRDILPETKVVS